MPCLAFLNCFFQGNKSADEPMIEQTSDRGTNRYSIRPSLSVKAMEEMINSSSDDETLNSINPFDATVQCTVSAKSAYPTKKDRVSYKLQNIQKNYLKFKQGDQICVLGKDNTTQMFIGYLELDSSKTVGYFAPNLVYADLTFITPVMVQPNYNITCPTKSFSTRKISFKKQNQGYSQI